MNKSSQIIGQLQVFARVAQLAVKVFCNYWNNYSVIYISSDRIPVHEATGGSPLRRPLPQVTGRMATMLTTSRLRTPKK